MNLIFSCAYGLEIHFALINEWARSIREHGYTGDLVLLSDRPREVPGCRVIVCEWMDPSQFWKAAIRKAVNCSDYDKILFMDSDIVCLKNPDLFFELEGIQIPQEPLTVIESGLNSVFLSVEEIPIHSQSPSFNAGTLVMPGKDADEFFTVWENEWRCIDYSKEKDHWPDTVTYKGQMYDQGILQIAIIRGLFPKMPKVMPTTFIGFPALPGKDEEKCVALHLCGLKHNGSNKNKVLDYMIQLRDPSKVAQISRDLKFMQNPIRHMLPKLDFLGDLIENNFKALEEKYEAAMKEIKKLAEEIRLIKEPVL